MEVILRSHVDNLGRRGEIVKVANGYARNYLLPRKLALAATDENRRRVERERKIFDAREAEEKAAAAAVATRISLLDARFARRVGETDTLYGSVTTGDLTEWLAGHHIEVDRRRVQLDEAIKRLGDYEVPIRLHREVTAVLKVRVVSETAAESA